MRHFDFIPRTFRLPVEVSEFRAALAKDKGVWIVKPAAKSQGRGIYLVTNANQIFADEPSVLLAHSEISESLLTRSFCC
jgi:hypothetical protein